MTADDRLRLRFARDLERPVVWMLLILLLAWSFGIRLWYATPELNSTRFWDERYGLENLEPLLKEGQLRPVHGFHPGFSYLPHGLLLKTSDLLYRATGWPKLAIFDARGRYTETTYLICRSVSVLFGGLSLLLLFLIGRRLGGDRLGLLAAWLLAIVPWHLRQSVLFKADITLLFTVMLTLYLSLRAIDKPSRRSFAASGMAIGLSLSSKFNAGPVAIPLTVGAFLRRGSKWRAFLLLALAAVVSVVVFLLLQPYVLIDPEIYRRSMGTTSRVYERVAERAGHGRLYLFWHLIESLLSGSFHGPIIGTLAVTGLVTVAVLAVRQRRTSTVALPWLMLLSYVAGYTLLYALATPRPSPHNWLPLSPIAALGAAWALLAIWLSISTRLPAQRARLVGAACCALLVLATGWQASHYVYRETVPRTGDRALDFLRWRLNEPDGRVVYSEHDFQILFPDRHKKGRLAIQQVETLSEFENEWLDRVDAEVFPTARLEDPKHSGFFLGRLEGRPNEDVLTVEPRFLRAWGPPVTVAVHPLEQTGQWQGQWVRSDEDPLRYVARLPEELESEKLLSVEFWVPRRTKISGIEVPGRDVHLVVFRGPRRQVPMTTTRFAYQPTLYLDTSKARSRDRFPLTIRSWRAKQRSSPSN